VFLTFLKLFIDCQDWRYVNLTKISKIYNHLTNSQLPYQADNMFCLSVMLVVNVLDLKLNFHCFKSRGMLVAGVLVKKLDDHVIYSNSRKKRLWYVFAYAITSQHCCIRWIVALGLPLHAVAT